MTSDNILESVPLHPQFGVLLVRRRNFFIVLLVAAGILLGGWNLGSPVLVLDEAESAINALTILEHGAPTDRYLDLPVYDHLRFNFYTGLPLHSISPVRKEFLDNYKEDIDL